MCKLKRQLKVPSSCKLHIHQCSSIVQRLICILSLLWNIKLENSSQCNIHFSLKTTRDIFKDTNTFIDIYYYLRFWGHNFCVRFLRSNELCTCKKVQCLPSLVILTVLFVVTAWLIIYNLLRFRGISTNKCHRMLTNWDITIFQ